MTHPPSQQLTVDPIEHNWRLDHFLAKYFPLKSRSTLQKWINAGCIAQQTPGPSPQNTSQNIPGSAPKNISCGYKVKTGQCYDVFPQEVAPLTLCPEKVAFDVVYDDQDIAVINKPPGLVVHPGCGHGNHTLVNGLLYYFNTLSSCNTSRPGLVHRLDKGTSGLLVIAKNNEAHHFLSSQFSSRTISRTYLAFVWGVLTPSQGSIEKPIMRHPIHRKKMWANPQKGKYALTFYETKKTYGGLVSLVQCRLQTGRTHQIRAHLESTGHSLLGDPLYTGSAKKRVSVVLKKSLESFLLDQERPALHAGDLSFLHPKTHKKMFFHAPLPPDILHLEEKLNTCSFFTVS